MKKILIAGGAGYVGSVLIPRLIERQYDVTVVDLLWFGNNLPSEAKVINSDIRTLTPSDLSDFDVVIFMAGVSNDPMANFNPSMNFVENASSPTYLAFISKEAGVKRFIYASSCSIYGYTNDKLMNEESPVSPKFPYGISKMIGENAVMSFEDESFRPIALRKGTVGGYSPRMRYDLVVNTMTKFALTQGKIVVNNPSVWRPLTDVRDIATAYIRAIEASQEITGVFNVSYDNYTMGRLADEIKSELSDHGINVGIEIKNIPECRNYKVTNSKTKDQLDFAPQFSPGESVREILKNIDLSTYDFNNKTYYNIKIFEEKFGS